jgi:hypothetical protein
MKTQLITTTKTTGLLAATVAVLVIGVGGNSHAQNEDTRPGPRGYTVLDHPAKPCSLSVKAVANWGETSAHLPQACTYGD